MPTRRDHVSKELSVARNARRRVRVPLHDRPSVNPGHDPGAMIRHDLRAHKLYLYVATHTQQHPVYIWWVSTIRDIRYDHLRLANVGHFLARARGQKKITKTD